MPQLGESVLEGTITKWLKAKGEPVGEYEPLLEVNTDKVDTEIPSPASGVLLDILVREGTTVQAGSLLAWIGETGEHPTIGDMVPSSGQSSEEPETTVENALPVRAGRDLGFISPVVSRMASEHGIDLSQVPGTGQGGRITKKDVQAYLEKLKVEGPKVGSLKRAVAPAPSLPPSPIPAPLTSSDSLLPMTTIRRSIAEHMLLSKHTSPHVTTVMEADMSLVAAHREANKATFARDGVNLTFTAYLISAAIAALKAHPMVNSSWSEAGVVLHRQIHIGMATSLGDEGLIVPVIKNADGLSLLGLARAINDLAERARAKKLQPDEVKGGTFTLTNHGTSGSLFATPIINQPQCAILGAGVIQKRAVVINDAIAIRPMMYISLTFDHRILDGASADHFLAKVVETLQNWS
jgi:2-oxoglutarate dehydrogenase E2 component (dihydrolipoamide succinyltransferase)